MAVQTTAIQDSIRTSVIHSGEYRVTYKTRYDGLSDSKTAVTEFRIVREIHTQLSIEDALAKIVKKRLHIADKWQVIVDTNGYRRLSD